jgi:hypothetical protein
MSRCREFYNSRDSDLTLVCDLDEHDGILPFHYDKLNEIEWRHPLVPAGVPATRTTPPKKLESKAALVEVFDVS